MAKTNINKSELFKVMNQLRKEGMSQKDAYAKAYEQLAQRDNNVENHDDLSQQLVAQMMTKRVKFTFINRQGKTITTTGTLVKNYIPTGRKVEGSRKPKSENHVVYYDARHGVYRQFEKSKVVAIL